jgi:RHS repeat-associated protein
MREHGNGRYSRQQLFYDGANQLTAVQVDGSAGQGDVALLGAARYVYDALGRRLKKTVKDGNGQIHASYFGWDGNQLVRTETIQTDGSRDIEHIVYEPGTFTPMIRFSARAKGAPQAKLHFIEQVALASLAPEMRDDPGQRAQLRDMVQTMSAEERKASEKGFRKALEQGFTPQMQINLSASGINPEALLANMRRDIEAMKQIEQLPVAIEFYHCDHLGTPVALTDQQGQITWAARHDPWGNIEEEFNPNNIEQNIRLPGQYHDRETGLYYNRFRYYDPKIGAFINQDPIGLKGNVNLSAYVRNPLKFIDPYGLAPVGAASKVRMSNAISAQKGAAYEESIKNGPTILAPENGYPDTAAGMADKIGYQGYTQNDLMIMDRSCKTWTCRKSKFTCGKNDDKKATDYIPPAVHQPPEPGCVCRELGGPYEAPSAPTADSDDLLDLVTKLLERYEYNMKE